MEVHNSRHSAAEWPLANEDELVQRVIEWLKTRLGNPVSNFELSRRDDGLVLRGVVQTYYAKQMVQEVVMDASGQVVLANDIEVQCSSVTRRGNASAR